MTVGGSRGDEKRGVSDDDDEGICSFEAKLVVSSDDEDEDDVSAISE